MKNREGIGFTNRRLANILDGGTQVWPLAM